MLDRFKGIWNNNQTIATKQVKRESLKSLKEQYDAKIQAKVFADEEVKEFTELIEAKEQNILELLNALDMLYTAKNTLIESKEKAFIDEEPFEYAKEYDEMFNAKSDFFGYTGPRGPMGSAGYTGLQVTTTLGVSNNPAVGNSNLSSQFSNPLFGKQKK